MDSNRPEPVPLVGVSRRPGRYDHAAKPPAEAGTDGTLAGAVPGRLTRSLVLVAILAATLAACGDRDGSAPGSAASSGTTAVVAAQEPEHATGSDSEPTTAAMPAAEPVTVPVSTAPESTPAASNDPEQPSPAPPAAAEPAPEPPTETDTSQDGVSKSTLAASEDPEQPSAAAPPSPEPPTETVTTPQDRATKSTVAASEDPEQPSAAAPPAPEPAPEPPTETDTSQDGVLKSTVAASEDPEQPSAEEDISLGGVSTGGLRGPPPEPPPEGERVAASKGERRGGGGVPYVWRDGDRIRRARLQADLVLQPSSDNRDDDVVVRDYGSNSIVERRTRHAGRAVLPVFRDEGGSLATLPGGVLVVLDPDWDQGRVNRFFSANGIKRSRVIQQAFADNAYLVETDPGFPSLELANELAELDGVVLSSPNWQTEITFR